MAINPRQLRVRMVNTYNKRKLTDMRGLAQMQVELLQENNQLLRQILARLVGETGEPEIAPTEVGNARPLPSEK